MNEFGTGKGIDFWTIAKMIVGILIFVLIIAGIVSVAGPFVDNIGAADTTNSGEGGTGGSGTEAGANVVPTETSETSTKTNLFVGTTGRIYNVNNLPNILEIIVPEKRKDNFQFSRITEIDFKENKISFCIENTGLYPIKIWELDIKDSHGTSIQFWNNIEVPAESKKCFVTKDTSKHGGTEFPIKLPIEGIKISIR